MTTKKNRFEQPQQNEPEKKKYAHRGPGRPRTYDAHIAALVWDLKLDGDVADDSGRGLTGLLTDRIYGRGYKIGRSNLNAVLREAIKEGVVERDHNPVSQQTFAIRLVETGKYGNPYDDEGWYIKREEIHRTKRISELVLEIERLPIPERLMLVGMIIDNCAGDVFETYTKLRTILGQVPEV